MHISKHWCFLCVSAQLKFLPNPSKVLQISGISTTQFNAPWETVFIFSLLWALCVYGLILWITVPVWSPILLVPALSLCSINAEKAFFVKALEFHTILW